MTNLTPGEMRTSNIVDVQYDVLLKAFWKILDHQAIVLVESQTDGIVLDRFTRNKFDLALKVAKHCSSIQLLAKNTDIQLETRVISFVDYSSVASSARSAFEAYLVFNHIFKQPQADQIFRYNIWKVAGLVGRINNPVSTPDAIQRKGHDQIAVNQLIELIQRDPLFDSLEKGHFSQIRRGNWRGSMSWIDLAVNAGFHDGQAKSLYAFLSSHSHSDFISLLQTEQAANDIPRQGWLANMGKAFACQILAMLIRDFCFAFPNIRLATTCNEDEIALIRFLEDMASDANQFFSSVNK